MNEGFTLDRRNGRIMGVCAGIARRFGWNAFWLRMLTVALLFITGPVVLLIYFVLGWIAD